MSDERHVDLGPFLPRLREADRHFSDAIILRDDEFEFVKDAGLPYYATLDIIGVENAQRKLLDILEHDTTGKWGVAVYDGKILVFCEKIEDATMFKLGFD